MFTTSMSVQPSHKTGQGVVGFKVLKYLWAYGTHIGNVIQNSNW